LENQVPAESGEAIKQAPRVISAQNAYIVNSLMQDVVQYGTARRAKALGRSDLAGKTGTTNDQRDAWFVGFNRDLLAISWVGFDDSKPLGTRETGGVAALPIWLDYMKSALDGKPNHLLDQPEGMVTLRIDPETGLRASSNTPGAIFEIFRNEYAPTQWAPSPTTIAKDPFTENDQPATSPAEQLF
jgi:penicillin-binding protein 1A